ncbi:hypothetical protein [Thiohalobacter thiocyanaticus]|uniref:Uncharacterized protein n=1 Tax=Thiohalobacter thiocyanaticus TaxID=585455 RepID=A0A426QJ03_9GAMM|nr:hypothetical protein [Thiohalobacter thiocyanaticus]RRQ21696.1 hypothetical protein D6C00_06865 [Thiohalobacter thiocyanaticus]
MSIKRTTLLTLALSLSAAQPALAYVGPGAGLSLLGAFWGLIVVLFAALGFIIFWPLRRFRRRVQTSTGAGTDASAADDRKPDV